MADTKTITKAEEIICKLTNSIDQALAVLSLGIDSLPTVNFDGRTTSAFYAVESILEKVSDKIIPVWHKNRGIKEFQKMCQDYAGRIVAITGFKNEDIQDHQYMMFLKYAKQYNCKVHCLGMTRKKILDAIPFDFADSSSWKQQAIFGRIGTRKVSKQFSKDHRPLVMAESLKQAMQMQDYYYKRWRGVCKD